MYFDAVYSVSVVFLAPFYQSGRPKSCQHTVLFEAIVKSSYLFMVIFSEDSSSAKIWEYTEYIDGAERFIVKLGERH